METPSLTLPARRKEKWLVVAVHDVAPEWLDEIRFLLGALDNANIRPRVLKVIPQNLLTSPDLVALLQAEQRQGSEIVMHGYSHETSGRLRGPWPRRLRAALFASHAAEFLSLSPADMEARLAQARQIFDHAGLSASGFCAPGWIESPDLPAVLRRSGFRYDIRLTRLIDLQHGQRIWTDWIGYMGAGRTQEGLVRIANSLNRAGSSLFRVLKAFLHPQHARESTAGRRILDEIPTLMRERTLTTFGQLVAR